MWPRRSPSPADYRRTVPDRETDKGHWVTYTDLSGSVWIFLNLDKKSEDANGYIKDSAAAEMYQDNGDFVDNGSVDLDIKEATKTVPEPSATYGASPRPRTRSRARPTAARTPFPAS